MSYKTGTIAVTNGSAAVVGTTTLWLSGAVVGDVLVARVPGGTEAHYEIATITDDTHLTLDRVYEGTTGSGLTYIIFRNSSQRDSYSYVSKQLSDLLAGYSGLVDATTKAVTITSAAALALAVGLNGITNPAFQVDASTALSATGIKIKSAAAAAGVDLSVISSGTNEALRINAKGSGTITIGDVSTGAITLARATAVTGALTASTSITAGSFVDAAAASGYRLGGNTVMYGGATYTYIKDGAGVLVAIQIGNTGDPTNYYVNTTHNWQSRAGGAMAQLDATKLNLSMTTASTSTTTGALTVAGGLGVAGALYVGGTARAANFLAPTSATTDALTFGWGNSNGPGIVMWGTAAAGVGAMEFYFAGSKLFQISNAGTVQALATTASTSTTTGALVVSGGVGIAGAVSVGGNVSISGKIGVGGAYTPSQTFMVRTGTDNNLEYSNLTAGVHVACFNNARDAYRDMRFSGLSTAFHASAAQKMFVLSGGVLIGTGSTATNPLSVEGIAAPQTDNSYTLGTSGLRWSTVYATTGTINTSDERLKTRIQDSKLGLEFILALEPKSYAWKNGGTEVTFEDETKVVVSREGVRTHYGLIAQQVKRVLDAQGIADFAGYVLENKDDPESLQSLRYDQFIAPLIKAVQELNTRIIHLEARA